MKIKYILSCIITCFFICLTLPSYSCKNSTEPIDLDTTIIIPPDSIGVYKPNIYLYPSTEIDLTIELEFPKGGHVTISEPEYQNGWTVSVKPNGLINDEYSFLFYEAITPNVWQYESGWFVPHHEHESFFSDNLSLYGFNDDEIEDFIEYWIPIFNSYEDMVVFPQVDEEIDEIIKLNVSVRPDVLKRLFYVVMKDSNNYPEISTPEIIPTLREGFCIMEWGVIQN